MTEIPSRLVGADPEDPLKLVSAHALLALAHQEDGEEPRPERQVGIVHDRSSRHAELVVA